MNKFDDYNNRGDTTIGMEVLENLGIVELTVELKKSRTTFTYIPVYSTRDWVSRGQFRSMSYGITGPIILGDYFSSKHSPSRK